MRILHVIWNLNPGTGGPPRVCVRLAAGQAAAGDQVTIASNPIGPHRAAFDEMVERLPGFKRVRVVEVSLLRWSEAMTARAARGTLKELVNDHDIVHLHNVWDPILFVAARTARQADRPYFVQPNGMLDPWAMSQRGLKKRLAMRLGFRSLLDGAGGLILGHENERRLLMPMGLAAPVTLARLNGVFPEEIDPLPSPAAFRAGVPGLGGDPYVVFLGRFHFKKGLDLLAEGFARHAANNPRTRLVMIGKDSGAEADFRQRIAGHRLDSRVHMVGQLHGPRKWEALAGAACFALPSRQEGFSVAVTEALACALPVVLTRDCHYDEVGEHDAGVVTGLDAAEVGAAFDRVLNDDAGRARMLANARRLVENQFNYHAVKRAVDAAYAAAAPRLTRVA